MQIVKRRMQNREMISNEQWWMVMKPHKSNETLPAWHRLHVSFTWNLEISSLGVVCDNLDVELALVGRIKEKKVGSQFKVDGSRPGGGLPIFTRDRRIFFTSSGSVITASIFMGEPHLTHSSGFTSYTLAINRAYPPAGTKTPGGHRHAALLSDEQTEQSGLYSSCVSGESGESRCFCLHPSGASRTT